MRRPPPSGLPVPRRHGSSRPPWARRPRRRSWRSSLRWQLRRLAWKIGVPALLIWLAGVFGPLAGDRVMVRYSAVDGCRVNYIVDGDTIDMACPGESTFRARLTGFDAPEVFSPGCASELAAGIAATHRLRTLLWSAERVEFALGGHDRYNRRLVRLTLDGRDVAETMVATGHARAYDGGGRAGWCA
jgi:micrococcal nuclease